MMMRQVQSQGRESCRWVRIGLRIRKAGHGALTSATQAPRGAGAPKAGGPGPPCYPFPPQLFATKGLISDSGWRS